MKKSIFERRMPTVFALVFLLAGLAVTTYLIQRQVSNQGHASPNEQPQNVQIVNITENAFTVTFTTLDPTVAAASITSNGNTNVTFENQKSNIPRLSHFIVVNGLSPNTEYSFTILSNGTAYTENGKSYLVKTAAQAAGQPGSSITGTILLPDGNPATDALVIMQVPQGALAGAITDSNGEYTILGNFIRSLTHDQYMVLQNDTLLTLTVNQGTYASKVSATYTPSSDIPTITLSNDYSFIQSATEEVSTSSASLLTIPTGPVAKRLSITTPKTNESFVDQKPLFRGTATPGSLVNITIYSNPITATVRADPNGNWAYRPAVIIPPGNHTITITTSAGSQSTPFTVFASGSQVAESATPSATLSPSPIATATPTSTPTPTTQLLVSPSASPAATVSPTETPTPTLTPTSTPTTALSPSPTITGTSSHVPPTGSTEQTLILTSLSVLFIVAGSVIFFVL